MAYTTLGKEFNKEPDKIFFELYDKKYFDYFLNDTIKDKDFIKQLRNIIEDNWAYTSSSIHIKKDFDLQSHVPPDVFDEINANEKDGFLYLDYTEISQDDDDRLYQSEFEKIGIGIFYSPESLGELCLIVSLLLFYRESICVSQLLVPIYKKDFKD